MGNARWTGVRLRELLHAAAPKTGSLQVQFQGLESGGGPEGYGSHFFMKSLDLSNPVLDECLVAYAMNGEPLPMLNGFPVRLVVPGYFATYWMKCLTWIRVLDKTDDNFWMKTAYRVPDTPRGNTAPDDVKAGTVKTIPVNRMPVRSFLISPDGDAKIPAGMPVQVRGIAFSGYGGVTQVDVSSDGLKTWQPARLGEDFGALFLPHLGIHLDAESARPLHPGGARLRQQGKHATRPAGVESRRLSLEPNRAPGLLRRRR